jgi:hypothetical protein
MNIKTVPQQAELCRNHALTSLAAHSNGLTVRELQQLLPPKTVRQQDLQAAIDVLQDEGEVDYEQRRSETKVYFLAKRPPRARIVRVAAHSLPPVQMAPRTWFAALGATA